MCVVSSKEGEQGRLYRLPTDKDFRAIDKVKAELSRNANSNCEQLSRVPEEISLNEIRRISVPLMNRNDSLGRSFTCGKALALSTLTALVLLRYR